MHAPKARHMKARPKGKKETTMTRVTVSFPSDLYRELDRIAANKKVSLAWVVREAAEKYIESQWPLFPKSGPTA